MASFATETVARDRARVTAPVGGMQCSLCTEVVERALREQPGVHAVSVSLSEGQARVEYDPARITPEGLQATVAGLGFTAGEAADATGLVQPIWAMVVMAVSVTAVFANSMRGKWSTMFTTLADIIKQRAIPHRSSG